MSDFKEVVISDREVVQSLNLFTVRHIPETALRLLCKQKGVPMKGSILPKLDLENYEYKRFYDEENLATVVRWREKA